MNKNITLTSALYYLEKMSWSVIPLNDDKKPIIVWEKYQKEKATKDDVMRWFGKYPNSMIGIVTGKISDLVVVDFDSKDQVDLLMEFEEEQCVVETPRGYHVYFHYRDGISNRTNLFDKVDIRAEGGYVVAPPSVNKEGAKYLWSNLDIKELKPEIVGDLPNTWYKRILDFSKPSNPAKQAARSMRMFVEGRRDDDLFNLAYTLFKGGKTKDEIKPIVLAMATQCKPPFPEHEALQKIASAEKRLLNKSRNLMQEAREWVEYSTGFFHRDAMARALNISTPEEKNNFRVILSRLQDERVIEKFGYRDGQFIKLCHDYNKMDIQNVTTKGVDIKYPFGIHEFFKTLPSNLIVVAGVPDGGKSAFVYNTIRMNMDKWDCHLLNTDCGPEELNERLIKFEDKELFGNEAVKFKDWRFTPWEVPTGGYAELIEGEGLQNSLVCVDFLELGENFYRVGVELDRIRNKMDKGVAIVGLQKSYGKEFGRGGDIGMARPRLYITIEGGICKILKCKNRNPGYGNYNGKLVTFKLVQGAKFIQEGVWRDPGSDPKEKSIYRFS